MDCKEDCKSCETEGTGSIKFWSNAGFRNSVRGLATKGDGRSAREWILGSLVSVVSSVCCCRFGSLVNSVLSLICFRSQLSSWVGLEAWVEIGCG